MLKGVQVPPAGAGVAQLEGVGVVAEVVVAEVLHNIIVLNSTDTLPCPVTFVISGLLMHAVHMTRRLNNVTAA